MLTPKQQRFVEEYLLDLNGTQAAVRAGYSPKTANEQAARLLAKASVSAAVAEAQKARSERTGITVDRVLQELARIGFSDVRRLFDGAHLRAIVDLDDETAAAVSSVEVTTKGRGARSSELHKVKSWDKPRALELIARHLGMLKDRSTLDVPQLGDVVALLSRKVVHNLLPGPTKAA